jgi:glycosyltransferase involved in cell wall biosynthesis
VAKALNYSTVLGQIDPGLEEERIVRAETERHPDFSPGWPWAPLEYWRRWDRELELADKIVVNSQWTANALIRHGVQPDRLEVIPLAFVPSARSAAFQRQTPDTFNSSRPLRVLFLGQVLLRKGIAYVLKAAKSMLGRPVEFWVVGPIHINVPREYQDLPNVRWIGRVARDEVDEYFKRADVFLFPTLSDGFGLTQLEAAAWGLPIIASRNCARVVVHEESGLELEEVSMEAIISALELVLASPQLLAKYSESVKRVNFDFGDLSVRLAEISRRKDSVSEGRAK